MRILKACATYETACLAIPMWLLLSATAGSAQTITTPTQLPFGVVGWSYVLPLEAPGIPSSQVWTLSDGSLPLPPGLVVGSEGLIRGVPTATGTYDFTVTMVVPGRFRENKSFRMNVVARGARQPLIMATSRLADGIEYTENQNRAYLETLDALGGQPPYTWSVVSGKLPTDLRLDSRGQISGGASASGRFDFTLKVTDSAQTRVDRGFSLIINSFDYTVMGIITPSRLYLGAVGVGYPLPYNSQVLTVTGGGGNISWVVDKGQLPLGLTLDRVSGAIRGNKPSIPGVYNFTATATDSTGASVSKLFTLIVAQTTIDTTTLPDPMLRVPYSQTLSASGGFPPYAWALDKGTLPPGLTLDPAGILKGTPSTGGDYSFTLRLSDCFGYWVDKITWSQDYRVRVAAPPPLVVTTPATLTAGKVGVPYALDLAASGGAPSYTWKQTSGNLPAGLALNEGRISGTPTTPGTSTFTAQVTDSVGTNATRAFTLTIDPAELAIASAVQLPAGTLAAPYSQNLQATGGSGTFTWSRVTGTLPPGLSVSSGGVISGTPTAAGSFTFTLSVTDGKQVASQGFSITIGLPVPPAVSLVGLLDTVSPTDQPKFDLNLATGYPATITGQVRLSFTPDVVNLTDNLTVQFSSGGGTVNFSIPVNTTKAVLPANIAVLVGTVAGTITVTATLQVGDIELTPSPAATRTMRVNRLAPTIRSPQDVKVMNKTGSSFEVAITGFATSREVTRATFVFAGKTNLQTSDLTVPLDTYFGAWYKDPNSAKYGSSFVYVQPFTITGDSTAVASVSVRLTNQQGDSQNINVVY